MLVPSCAKLHGSRLGGCLPAPQGPKSISSLPPRQQALTICKSSTSTSSEGAPSPSSTATTAHVACLPRRAALLSAAAVALTAVAGLDPNTSRAEDAPETSVSPVATEEALPSEPAPALQPAAPPAAAPAAQTLESQSLIDGQGETRLLPKAATADLTQAQKQVLEYNLRSQRQNSAPPDFPAFVRQGYDMTILADGYQVSPEGLIYKDFVEGSGAMPAESQQVVFDYTAYNESAAIIDSSYRKGQAAVTQIGINGLIPGFELGLRTMKPGGKRRIVVPPELGPPVGPSTFFSAKQFEVFDIELRAVKTCSRRTVGFFSSVVCE